jgi:hypothetical protein
MTAQPVSSSSLAEIKEGSIAYYTKENLGTDTLKIIRIHPGLPAPTESLTVVVTHSYDPMRIGRELNIVPTSTRFHILKKENRILSIPLIFRKTVLDMCNKKVEEESEDTLNEEMLVLERDMIDYVASCQKKQEEMLVDYD